METITPQIYQEAVLYIVLHTVPWILVCLAFMIGLIVLGYFAFRSRYENGSVLSDGVWHSFDGKRDYYASVSVAVMLWFFALIFFFILLSFVAKLVTMDATVIYYLHGGVL